MIEPLLELRKISKRFSGVEALKDVSLIVARSEVHGLLGENGSGKSTLIKILAGYHAPEPGGEFRLRGELVPLPLRPGDFRRLGMAFVHQDLGLAPDLTVLENLLMVRLSTSTELRIDWRAEHQSARQLFDRFGLRLDPMALVREVSDSDRALLAIVRAATEMDGASNVLGHANNREESSGAGLLVLDEPTVYLSGRDVERLVVIMHAVTDGGGSVLFVSHDLDEVLQYTDRSTVLRDGVAVQTVASKVTTKADLVRLIIGHELAIHRGLERSSSASPGNHASIELSRPTVVGLTGGRSGMKNVSFSVGVGEIVGITGLIGSGFEEVPYLLFGATRAEAGSLSLDHSTVELVGITPRRAINAGLALIPADRQRDGAVLSLSVSDNVMLQVLGSYRHRWWLERRRMRADADRVLSDYGVRCGSSRALYQTLSGGNQQKALLARWLQTRPRLLLLHEPTQGVDVGSREEIFERLLGLAATGIRILCASSDHEQLEAICSRVLVMSGGQIVAELEGEDVRKVTITAQCLSA